MKPLLRTLIAVGLPLLCTVPAHATPVTFTDPYNVGSPDVIGLVSKFDLHSVELVKMGTSGAEFNIRMNYNNGSTSLAPFSVGGVTLRPGDLLFQGAHHYWGVALASNGHGGIVAGHLYQATGFLTAKIVLGNPSGVIYRPTDAVWFDPNGAVWQAAGTVVTTRIGVTPEVNVNLKFATSAAFLKDISGGYDILMATATCANDILRGHVAAVPEPATWSLIALGLGGMVLLRRTKLSQDNTSI